MERKRRAVIGAWECVKFGHFGARLRFAPSCDAGIFPAVPLIPALKCWCKHAALAGRAVPGARRGDWFLPKHLAAQGETGLMSSLGWRGNEGGKGKNDFLKCVKSMFGALVLSWSRLRLANRYSDKQRSN